MTDYKLGSLVKERTILVPKEGLKESTWYLCDVSMKSSNPIYRALFYTGFLNKDLYPMGYSGGFPINYAPDEITKFSEYFYFKPLYELNLKDKIENIEIREWKLYIKPRYAGKSAYEVRG